MTIALTGLARYNTGEREAAVQLAKGAVSKVSSSLGRETAEIKVASSDVSSLASWYGASAEEVTAVAGQADTYQGWSMPRARVDRMAEAAKAEKNDKAVSAGVGVACDSMAGKITSPAQFQNSVTSAIGMTYTDAVAFQEATTDLAEKLATIKAQGSPEDKAAAALLCYAYPVVPVK
ncbi:hypothetical protein JOE40_000776 [Arthrobacter sp. PvP102]|uniref:hypothetical protein n=1 Tax=unclassified Arthrobacter TaxID=235627 RepID=UPI001AE2E9D8|nr:MULTISPECIES: hypothetical protein [unclassified Arthrobacter]MBP1235308.1 hypothetical protein [Arthrobacter sp. PvP103]MBP1236267.1 hypothetical protein [Arthrobacter sp. PvP102]